MGGKTKSISGYAQGEEKSGEGTLFESRPLMYRTLDRRGSTAYQKEYYTGI